MKQSQKTLAAGIVIIGLIGIGVYFDPTVLPYGIGTSIIVALLMVISIIKTPTSYSCPICLSRDIVTWVLPGKHCLKCGTRCNL